MWRICIRLLFVTLTCGVSSLTWGQQPEAEEWSAAKERKEYSEHGFSGIRVLLPGYVRLEQGTSYDVIGESSVEGILDRINVRMEGGNLTLDADEALRKELKSHRKQPVVRFTVRTPRIEDIVLLGSGDIIGVGDISTPKLRILLRGSGDIKLGNVQSPGEVNALLQGSGDLSLKQIKAKESEYSLQGSGDIDVEQSLVQQQLRLSLHGSGDLKIRRIISQDLDISLHGSGDVKLEIVDLLGTYTADLLGSGDVSIRRIDGAQLLRTNLLGSCSMTFGAITASRVEFRLRGSGDINVQEPSKTSSALYSLLSSGDITAEKLIAGDVEVAAIGSGDIFLYATNSLNVTSMTGSCTINYRGNPKIQFQGSGPVEVRPMK